MFQLDYTSISMSNNLTPEMTDDLTPEMVKARRQKAFWPQPEQQYLDETPPEEEGHDFYVLSLNLSDIEEFKTGTRPEEDQIKYFKLKHPTWSKTLFDMASNLGGIYGTEETAIPIVVLNYSDNSNETGIETDVNEVGNGGCPITLELYCWLFENFDFTNEVNQEFLYRVYTCESETGYRYTKDDYQIDDNAKFISHFEEGRTRYQRAQLMQSLLLLSDFLNCKFVQDFVTCRLAYYINEQINEFCSLPPEKLREVLKPDTDMKWVKDNDDLIVMAIRQWLGAPNNWESYEQYQDFKNKIGWIKDEEEDPDWKLIEKEAKKARDKFLKSEKKSTI